MTTASTYKGERAISVRQVAGSGGRVRKVAICEIGCWHGNYAQAAKCKNALGALATGDPWVLTPEARKELGLA